MKISFFLGLLLLFLINNHPNYFTKNNLETKWVVYNIENSPLPQNNITDIEFDSKGNIWLGTSGEGLVKFDRKNWTLYNKNNSGFSADYVTDIAIDANDVLWISSYGIIKFENKIWTTYNTGNSQLKDNQPDKIIFDKNGDKWITFTYNNLLCKMVGENIEIITSKEKELSKSLSFNDIYLDRKSNFWLADRDGIIKYNDNKCMRFPNSLFGGSNMNYVTSFYSDSKNNIWMGTWHKGLIKYSNGKWNEIFLGVKQNTIKKNEKNWYNGAIKTSWKYSENDKIENKDLKDIWVKTIFIDKQDNIYVGTSENGLIIITKKGNKNFNKKNSPLLGSINVIKMDSKGIIWLGTTNGLYALSN